MMMLATRTRKRKPERTEKAITADVDTSDDSKSSFEKTLEHADKNLESGVKRRARLEMEKREERLRETEKRVAAKCDRLEKMVESWIKELYENSDKNQRIIKDCPISYEEDYQVRDYFYNLLLKVNGSEYVEMNRSQAGESGRTVWKVYLYCRKTARTDQERKRSANRLHGSNCGDSRDD